MRFRGGRWGGRERERREERGERETGSRKGAKTQRDAEQKQGRRFGVPRERILVRRLGAIGTG